MRQLCIPRPQERQMPVVERPKKCLCLKFQCSHFPRLRDSKHSRQQKVIIMCQDLLLHR